MDRRSFLGGAGAAFVSLSGGGHAFGQILTEPTIIKAEDGGIGEWAELMMQTASALPYQGSGVISGEVVRTANFIKVRRLDISPKSRLIFRTDAPADIFLVADELYIQRPATQVDVSTITYQVRPNFLSQEPLTQARNGANAPDGNGQNGGNGDPGYDGFQGLMSSGSQLYFIFRKLTVQGGNPSGSTLLNLDFHGLDSGDGQAGGQGGNGGNGGRGLSGENNRVPYPIGGGSYEDGNCHIHPGDGGNTGRPGTGGKGGDAAIGGPGGMVLVICPESQAAKVAFAAIVTPGKPGRPGVGGRPGNTGVPGGGGHLTTYCRYGGKTGSILQATPSSKGSGAQPVGTASPGGYAVIKRDVSSVFS